MPPQATDPRGPDAELEGLRLRVARLEAENAELRRSLEIGDVQAGVGAADKERLSAILDSAVHHAFVTTDLSGQITGWSRGAALIFGYAEDEILGQDVGILFTPEDQETSQHQLEMQRTLRAGRVAGERWQVRKTGERFWAGAVTVPLRQGGVRGFLKIVCDETESRLVEERIERSMRQKEVLAREASHRVKNSLQLVASLLNLQARASADPDVKRAIGDAVSRVTTVARIHNRLWRHEEVNAVDLAAFLADLCRDLEASAPGCRLLYEATAPVSVDPDLATSLGLVVNELVTNAFKYACSTGEGEVRVRLDSIGGEALRLTVTDRGPGLPPGFDPARAGASLGMRLVTGFARQLQGRLDVSSAEPGARFALEIPQPAGTGGKPP